MNLSIPIIICDENDDIRLLLKEMLTKHGYFHLVEAHSSEEMLQLISDEQFVLIHENLMNSKIKKKSFSEKKLSYYRSTRFKRDDQSLSEFWCKSLN